MPMSLRLHGRRNVVNLRGGVARARGSLKGGWPSIPTPGEVGSLRPPCTNDRTMKVIYYNPLAANTHARLEDISRELNDCQVIIERHARDQ